MCAGAPSFKDSLITLSLVRSLAGLPKKKQNNNIQELLAPIVLKHIKKISVNNHCQPFQSRDSFSFSPHICVCTCFVRLNGVFIRFIQFLSLVSIWMYHTNTLTPADCFIFCSISLFLSSSRTRYVWCYYYCSYCLLPKLFTLFPQTAR